METLIGSLFRQASAHPDKDALVLKDCIVSYGELRERVIIAAAELHGLGIAPKDNVLYSAVSAPEAAIALLAIQRCGAIAVAVDKNARPDAIEKLYASCDARLLLTDKHADKLRNNCLLASLKGLGAHNGDENCLSEVYRPNPEDIAEMIFTTGTTGTPKGVMLSYRAVQAIWKNTVKGTGILPDDRILLPLPLNHSVALRVLRASLSIGATVVFQNGFTFAKNLEENVLERGCTALISVPASLETVRLQMGESFTKVLGRLRYIEVGAGFLTPSQRIMLASELPNTRIVNTWGSSETGGALFVDVHEVVAKRDSSLETIGKAVEGVTVRIGSEDEGPMHAGRLALRGDMAMSGYYGRDDLTAEALSNGWVVTNDLAYMQDEYVFMFGRADDIINVGGEKVSPVEVENVSCQFCGIAECACIGVGDPEGILGQVPVLFAVVRGSSYDESEFRRFLSSKLERYKQPRHIVLVDALPRNRVGKVDRKALRAQWEEGRVLEASKDLMNSVVRAILGRKSVRKFAPEPVRREILEMIIKAGYHAPSGHNMQTWRFTVLESAETITQLKGAVFDAAKLADVELYGFENPPCVVLVSNDERNETGCQDCSCAVENMMIAASSYGLGSVWINACMKLRGVEPLKSFLDDLGIPSRHVIWAIVAIGHPLSDGASPARRQSVAWYVDR